MNNFWKTRIEQTDPDKSFRVGLIYGPSGCGKSSLVKAGLLPRLADHVLPIYVESTADQTEQRMMAGLHEHGRHLSGNQTLVEQMSSLRRGQCLPASTKVLIVLDQFEQWLHAHREDEQSNLVLLNGEPFEVLVSAIRHCVGFDQCLQAFPFLLVLLASDGNLEGPLTILSISISMTSK